MKWTVRAPQESRSNGLVEVYQPSECVTFHMKQDRLALLPPSVALRIKLPFAWLCFISSTAAAAAAVVFLQAASEAFRRLMTLSKLFR